MMSLCLTPAVQANKNNIIERDGIYFKHMAQIAMGDSGLTVITDIDLSQIDKTIDQISDEIKRANITQHPSGDTDFTAHLKHRITRSLNSHNARLKTVTSLLNILKNAILGHENSRHRRSVLDGVGTAMNWLFGTAKSKQFTDLDIQFRKLSKRTCDEFVNVNLLMTSALP